MRRVTSALLLAALGTASGTVLLAGCAGAGGPRTGTATDQQNAYIEQISDEQQGLAHGELLVGVPTGAVQGGTGTMSITLSSVAGAPGAPTVRPSAGGTATASTAATAVLVGGLMAPQVSCQGVACAAVADNREPVGDGMDGQWTWNLSYDQSGTASVSVVAVLYQTDTSNVLWQSAPLTLTIQIGATAQQRVDRSLGWLHDTVISLAAVVAALTPGVAALLRWRSKRRKRAAAAAEKVTAQNATAEKVTAAPPAESGAGEPPAAPSAPTTPSAPSGPAGGKDEA